MSADVAGNESNSPVDAGPVIITVPGQDGHVDANAVEVVETKPVVVEEGKKEIAAGSEEQVEEERDEKGRFKPDAKTRIAQLTAARHDAERKAKYWEDVATGKVNPAKAEPAPVAAEVKQAPTRDQFANEEEFLDALTDHKVEVKMAQRDQQVQQVKEQTLRADDWTSKLASARAEIEGFDEVVNSAETPIAGHVASLIMEHDQGAKVMHHFAVNPEELEKINAMTPAKAAFAIAEVASQFKPTSSSKPAAEPPIKKISEAPPPAARNVGSGRSTTPALGDMSMDDYIATRKSQGASWAR